MIRILLIAYLASVTWSFVLMVRLIMQSRKIAKNLGLIDYFGSFVMEFLMTLIYSLIPIFNIYMGFVAIHIKPIDLIE